MKSHYVQFDSETQLSKVVLFSSFSPLQWTVILLVSLRHHRGSFLLQRTKTATLILKINVCFGHVRHHSPCHRFWWPGTDLIILHFLHLTKRCKEHLCRCLQVHVGILLKTCGEYLRFQPAAEMIWALADCGTATRPISYHLCAWKASGRGLIRSVLTSNVTKADMSVAIARGRAVRTHLEESRAPLCLWSAIISPHKYTTTQWGSCLRWLAWPHKYFTSKKPRC